MWQYFLQASCLSLSPNQQHHNTEMTALHYYAVFLHSTLTAVPPNMSLKQVKSVHLFRNNCNVLILLAEVMIYCILAKMSTEQLFTNIDRTQNIELLVSLRQPLH